MKIKKELLNKVQKYIAILLAFIIAISLIALIVMLIINLICYILHIEAITFLESFIIVIGLILVRFCGEEIFIRLSEKNNRGEKQ